MQIHALLRWHVLILWIASFRGKNRTLTTGFKKFWGSRNNAEFVQLVVCIQNLLPFSFFLYTFWVVWLLKFVHVVILRYLSPVSFSNFAFIYLSVLHCTSATSYFFVSSYKFLLLFSVIVFWYRFLFRFLVSLRLLLVRCFRLLLPGAIFPFFYSSSTYSSSSFSSRTLVI